MWQVSWAHPKYESVVATCGYDNKVKVWKRDPNGNWENNVFQYTLNSSVNCIAWAPWEYGLILAAGTAEGRVVVFARDADDAWVKTHDFSAHKESVNGISWGPPTEPALLSDEGKSDKFILPPKRLVSGGNDNLVCLWELRDEAEPRKTVIGQHADWVRDVAWCNNIGLKADMVASCSEDKTCRVWTHEVKTNSWTSK